jgi:hypothetical protein
VGSAQRRSVLDAADRRGGGQHHDSPPRRRRSVVAALAAAVLVAGLITVLVLRPWQATTHSTDADHSSVRMIAPGSWWNTPVPAAAPESPDAGQILQYMSTAAQSAGGYLHLAGAGNSPWGQPFYWAGSGDPTYRVRATRFALPPELASLRIPSGARPADTSDGAITVVDQQRGYVVSLWHAAYDAGAHTWSAGGAQVSYLDSNGLDARTHKSDDPHNRGSLRGNNGAVSAVRLDEVQAGSIDHVLKIALGPEASQRSVFPMVGSDGSSNDPFAPPTGLRLRIKPSVDLTALNLTPDALVIARAIQRYGVYIGDNSGTTSLKLENTRVEGRGQLWTLPGSALHSLPFTTSFWDVLPEGYDPSGTGGSR